VAQGNQASNNEEAIKLYQQAEDLLLEDMPIIPMDVRKELYVWSDKVDNINVDLFSRVDVAAVTVN
jgi:ABC-type transport system substrate-binding protein